MQSSAFAESSPHPQTREDLHEAALSWHVPLDRESAARSARNIALWRSYLPTACVQAMIRMGWDRTT